MVSNKFVLSEINKAKRFLEPLVIVDTDIHTTLGYELFAFDVIGNSGGMPYRNPCNTHIYLNRDLPFVQDGTRLDEEDRNLLDFYHRKILEVFKVDYTEVGGNWEERYETSLNLITKELEIKI